MILQTLEIDPVDLERRTGWAAKPQGMCKADMCVPLRDVPAGRLDARQLADLLRMPLVHDEKHDVWCLGPESGGRALAGAETPDLVLPDRNGEPFALRSLRGTKVFLLAWASW
jgi:hypothetical protein